MIQALYNLLTIFFLLFGLFFMFVGALGLWRLPDLYSRIHAASKCITLGISGLLLAGVLHLSWRPEVDHVVVVTKALLVIIFQFVASPVAAHMLSRAAHLDGLKAWHGMIGDELSEDRRGQAPRAPQPPNSTREDPAR